MGHFPSTPSSHILPKLGRWDFCGLGEKTPGPTTPPPFSPSFPSQLNNPFSPIFSLFSYCPFPSSPKSPKANRGCICFNVKCFFDRKMFSTVNCMFSCIWLHSRRCFGNHFLVFGLYVKWKRKLLYGYKNNKFCSQL